MKNLFPFYRKNLISMYPLLELDNYQRNRPTIMNETARDEADKFAKYMEEQDRKRGL